MLFLKYIYSHFQVHLLNRAVLPLIAFSKVASGHGERGGCLYVVLSWFLTQTRLDWSLDRCMLEATGPTRPWTCHGIHCCLLTLYAHGLQWCLSSTPDIRWLGRGTKQIGNSVLCQTGSAGPPASHYIHHETLFLPLIALPLLCSCPNPCWVQLRDFWFGASPSLYPWAPAYQSGCSYRNKTFQFQNKKGTQEHVGLTSSTHLFFTPFSYPPGPEKLGFAFLRGKVKPSFS